MLFTYVGMDNGKVMLGGREDKVGGDMGGQCGKKEMLKGGQYVD